MRIGKIGFISLGLAAVLVSSAVLAGRLDGRLATEDDEFAGANQACVVVDEDRFSVAGTVIGSVSPCLIAIEYATPLPNSASATALKSGKTNGSAKVSQSIDAALVVRFSGLTCTTEWLASSTAEKCKVTASVKGTAPATVDSSRVTVSCDLGESGENLTTEGGTAQFDALVAAFDGRTDVKLTDKGKLTIKHQGVPDINPPAQAPCDVATTTTTTTTSTTGATTTSTSSTTSSTTPSTTTTTL